MSRQPLIGASLLSSLLTLVVVALLVAWSGFATAQNTASETGEGLAQATVSGSTGDVAPPADAIALSDNGTGDGGAVSAAQAAPATGIAAASVDGMSHWTILGSHLQPRSSGVQFAYDGSGCIHVTNGGGEIRMQFPVILPDGSVVKSMDIFYQDTSTSALTVWLTAYTSGNTSSQDIVSALSTNAVGWSSASSSVVSHTIDNSANAYSLNYSWGSDTSNALQICGIRINYIDPFYSSFLPAIQQN